MAALLAVGGAYAIASWDWCGRWTQEPAKLVAAARATGALKAGAAEVELVPPWPVTVAGYGPVRPTVSRATRPLKARALVLQVGGVKAAIVAIDLLLIPQDVVDDVRAQAGLPDAWVVATHAHSSMGGYDERPLAELAGTGWFREAAKAAVVHAAVEALGQATAALAPAQARVGTAEAGLCRARSGTQCDGRLTRLTVLSEAGAPIAEGLVLAAHPTLIARKTEAVDPDYPGALAERRADAGVALVIQGAGGNASATEKSPLAFAEEVERRLPAGVALEGELTLATARATIALPHPDAARLVPAFSRVPATNFVCLDAARVAEVGVVRLGPVVWLSVPVEASFEAGASLEAAAGATRLVSLANGYLGYLEPAEVVAAAGGESKRQYYGAALMENLEEAAKVAGDAVR